jgi:hypothetical protein
LEKKKGYLLTCSGLQGKRSERAKLQESTNLKRDVKKEADLTTRKKLVGKKVQELL